MKNIIRTIKYYYFKYIKRRSRRVRNFIILQLEQEDLEIGQ